MKNKKIIRTFTATLAVVLCLTAFSTTAFAGGTDPNPEPLPETTEEPAGGNRGTHHRGDRNGAGGRTRHPGGQCRTGG